jgi:hypothetical protein
MDYTFKTSGTVEPIYKQDGTLFGYNVGRKDAGTIFLLGCIDEFYEVNVSIYIDRWGGYWAKKH